AARGTGVDMLLGLGGTPEGIIAACAIKATGGMFQGRLAPKDEQERQQAIDAGHDLERVLTTDDLVASDNGYFAATRITDGDLLRGGRDAPAHVTAAAMVMPSTSGPVRTVEAEHRIEKWSRWLDTGAQTCFHGVGADPVASPDPVSRPGAGICSAGCEL